MAAKIVEIIVMEGIAALMLVFAYVIGVKQKMHLIAGYNERSAASVHDKGGLARFIGRVCLVVGVASALMPLGTHLWGETRIGFASVTAAYLGLVVGVVALTILQAREYARSTLGTPDSQT